MKLSVIDVWLHNVSLTLEFYLIRHCHVMRTFHTFITTQPVNVTVNNCVPTKCFDSDIYKILFMFTAVNWIP